MNNALKYPDVDPMMGERELVYAFQERLEVTRKLLQTTTASYHQVVLEYTKLRQSNEALVARLHRTEKQLHEATSLLHTIGLL